MAIFRWIANSTSTIGDHYETAADFTDVTTGTTGASLPQPGDTIDITGLVNSGIYRLGALWVFPVGTAYTQSLFYAPQDPLTVIGNPDAIVGYTIQNQTLNVDGTAGIVSLWLENSRLQNDTINLTGTAAISSYLDSTVSGTITIGSGTTAGYLQDEVIPADTSLVGPADHYAVTTYNATINIGSGSTFDIESAGGGLVSGFISNGTINVAPGGTLAVDDEDVPNPATSPSLATFAFNNDLLFANGGTINLEGAPGQTTRAAFCADLTGPGAIIINGNGAASAGTSLLLNGSVTNQNITLTDGTVTVDDASASVQTPGLAGFDVTGGSFTFADGNGILVLHQAALTTLEFTADASGLVQTPDGRNPFTTPISGFQAGDVIKLPNKDLAGFGLGETYTTVYNAATHLLQIESPAGIAGNPPAILAALTFDGGYNPALFSLATSNSATQELDLTYNGEPLAAGLAGAIGAAGAVTDTTTPTLSGLAPGGSAVTLTDGGAVVGQAVASGAGAWSATLALPPGAGLQTITTATSAVGTGTTNVNLFELPMPVAGVSTPDLGSADLAGVLAQGYDMQFIPGTEAVDLTNGVLSVGPDTNEALVQRLYEGLLGRAADPGGLAAGDQLLSGGVSPAVVAADLLGSAEYAGLQGAPSNGQFVTNLYEGFLGRAPDPGGMALWTTQLAQGVARGQVAVGFANSVESKAFLLSDTASLWVASPNGEIVTQLYETGLGRVPDLGGLQGNVQALQAGVSPAQIAQEITGSAEFAALHAGQSATQLVTSFYTDGLGRAPDPGGLQGWVTSLQSGTPTATALLSFASSAEAYAHLSPSI